MVVKVAVFGFIFPMSGFRVNVRCLRGHQSSKIGNNGKFKLIDENLLKTGDVVLFIKNKHGFFVFNGFTGLVRNGAIQHNLSFLAHKFMHCSSIILKM